MPLNSQQVLQLNNTHVPADTTELSSSDLEFFFYTFSAKETAVYPVLLNTLDPSFGFDLKDCKLSGCTYIKDVDDTVSSSAAKLFGTCKQSRCKLCGAFITHIDGNPVFSTAQAQDKLKALFEKFLKAKAKDFSFEITFAVEDKLKGKQLKRSIDDYHFLLPGTTKQIKAKLSEDASTANSVTTKLDDRTEQFKLGMPIFKEFDKVKHKGKIIGYNSQHRLYEVEYEDGNKE